jgi:hypothetical protein
MAQETYSTDKNNTDPPDNTGETTDTIPGDDVRKEFLIFRLTSVRMIKSFYFL